jgi:hypothetical protein
MRGTIPRDPRLGAAKKKKRVRRTEGTGLNVGAHEIASGNAAHRDFKLHAFRH